MFLRQGVVPRSLVLHAYPPASGLFRNELYAKARLSPPERLIGPPVVCPSPMRIDSASSLLPQESTEKSRIRSDNHSPDLFGKQREAFLQEIHTAIGAMSVAGPEPSM